MQRTLSRHAQQSVHACVRVGVGVCVCVQPTLNNLLENREIGLPDGRWVSQAAAAFPVSIRHTTTTATTTTMQLGLRRSGFWCPRDGTTACSRFEHHALHSLPAPDRPLPLPRLTYSRSRRGRIVAVCAPREAPAHATHFPPRRKARRRSRRRGSCASTRTSA